MPRAKARFMPQPRWAKPSGTPLGWANFIAALKHSSRTGRTLRIQPVTRTGLETVRGEVLIEKILFSSVGGMRRAALVRRCGGGGGGLRLGDRLHLREALLEI